MNARIALALLLIFGPVEESLANFAITPSGSTTLFAIDGSNQGTSLCAAASTECAASVPVNTAGAPLFTGTTPGIVTANAGTNLNTSLLALETGGNLGTLVTDFGAPGATACATDTASCNLNQQMQRLAQRLTTINTTLGSPFQAGAALAANQSINFAQQNGVAVGSPLGNNADGIAPVTSGLAPRISYTYAYDGTNWNRAQTYTTGTAGAASTQVLTVQGVASMTPVVVTQSSQYPSGATAITASATGTTAATVATLAGVGGKTTYLCTFTISAIATAALAGNATVTGTITGTLNYEQGAGTATAPVTLTVPFNPCVPASAVNTGIAVNSIAAGTGGVTSVSATGYQL
jgi:hypothetical protein